jgi:hypothetical protein
MLNTESLHIPRYRRHKPSGQAVVTLNGKDHYLGRYNSAARRTTDSSRNGLQWEGARLTPPPR